MCQEIEIKIDIDIISLYDSIIFHHPRDFIFILASKLT